MTAPREGMNCSTCMYYEKIEGGHGECRRHAPGPNSSTFVDRGTTGIIKTDIHWPKVYESNWCGEYAQRTEA